VNPARPISYLARQRIIRAVNASVANSLRWNVVEVNRVVMDASCIMLPTNNDRAQLHTTSASLRLRTEIFFAIGRATTMFARPTFYMGEQYSKSFFIFLGQTTVWRSATTFTNGYFPAFFAKTIFLERFFAVCCFRQVERQSCT
jgi:hypothetical protein